MVSGHIRRGRPSISVTRADMLHAVLIANDMLVVQNFAKQSTVTRSPVVPFDPFLGGGFPTKKGWYPYSTLSNGGPKWVWVKIKAPGYGPQVLVHVATYQGKPFWVPIFDPQPGKVGEI